MKVELQYFKSSGKYYSSGDYETSKEEMFQIFEEVRMKAVRRTLPGLIDGAHGFYILVNVPGHKHEYPGLIVPGKFGVPE